MYKSKLAIFFDSIFISVVIFLISFFWIRKYIKTAFFIIFISISISLLGFILIFRYFIKKHNLDKLSLKDSIHLKKCINSFKFSSKIFIKNFFENLLNCNHKFANIYENENYIYYINFRTKLSVTDYYNLFDYELNHKNKTVIFLSENYDEEFNSLISNNKNYFVFNSNSVYKLMKSKNIFPADLDKHKPLKDLIKLKFSKFLSTITTKHLKDYLFSGLSLLSLSFFIPYSFYYAITGTILLLFAILCLFKPSPKKNPNINNIELSELIKK